MQMQTAGIEPPGRHDLELPVKAPGADRDQADIVIRGVEQEQENSVFLSGLAAYLRRQWTSAQEAKNAITSRLERNLRQRKGEYDPEVLAEIRDQGGSEIFMMLTHVKCHAAASWLREVLDPPDGDRAWSVDPTPIPHLPAHIEDQIKQHATTQTYALMVMTGEMDFQDFRGWAADVYDEVKRRIEHDAKRRCERMGDKIHDQLTEGNWHESIQAFIDDLVTYPSAFIMGPTVRRHRRLKWRTSMELGQMRTAPEVTEELIPTWRCVRPWDVYPLPHTRDVQDGGLFVIHRPTVKALNEFRGTPGFNREALDASILQYANGGLREWLSGEYTRQHLENRTYEWLNPSDRIDTLQYWGEAHGQMLIDWGMDSSQIPDPAQSYNIEAWLIGDFVVKAVLNPDPLGKAPIYSSSFFPVPGSIWGVSLPESIKDAQQMCNAAARAISNNMGIASGPQVVINDVRRLAAGEDVTQIYPWRIWQFGPDMMSTSTHRPPIEFYQPNPMVEQLLKVYDHFSKIADETSNIPAYAYGEVSKGTGGALSTASGFSMALGGATKGIKNVVSNMDKGITEPAIKAQYVWNMINLDDESLKGDAQVVARGAKSLLIKEQQQIRRMEFLDRTNNPADMQIMGLEGRAEVLRESAKSLDYDVTKVVPTEKDLMRRMLEQMPPQGGPMGASPEQPQTPEGREGVGPGGGPPNPNARTLDNAGNPAGGVDNRTFGR